MLSFLLSAAFSCNAGFWLLLNKQNGLKGQPVNSDDMLTYHPVPMMVINVNQHVRLMSGHVHRERTGEHFLFSLDTWRLMSHGDDQVILNQT